MEFFVWMEYVPKRKQQRARCTCAGCHHARQECVAHVLHSHKAVALTRHARILREGLELREGLQHRRGLGAVRRVAYLADDKCFHSRGHAPGAEQCSARVR